MTPFMLNIDNHTMIDFTEVYKFIITRYDKDGTCPAILMIDNAEPMIFKSANTDTEIVLLDRNSKTIKRDLKNIVRKMPIILNPGDETFLYQLWEPYLNYTSVYRQAYDICQYLKIEMPALFYYRGKSLATSNCPNCAYYSKNSGNLVTDIFIHFRMDEDPVFFIKTLIHELRHAWQHKYHNDWFEDYTFYDENKRNVDYHLQNVEIDADAFAYWLLEKNNRRFILEDLGEERALLIRRRMLEIDNEWKDPIKLCSFMQAVS